MTISFELEFEGQDAENHRLDFYDASVALMGFQRSLAITTHLVVSGEVITQAPSLKGARIFVVPPEIGSWKAVAIVVTAIGTVGTASRDSAFGHLIASAYDYVVSSTLGFHVDYEKSLGQQYEELSRSTDNVIPKIKKSQFDSTIEKCEIAIRDMHRPIVYSQTANLAQISYDIDRSKTDIPHKLSAETHANILLSREVPEEIVVEGRISSYNMNTHKGRIFWILEKRPIPFELSEMTRGPDAVLKITRSLSENARSPNSLEANIMFRAIRSETRTGRTRGFLVIGVE